MSLINLLMCVKIQQSWDNMSQNCFVRLYQKAKEQKLTLIVSLIYNFIWSICKIVLGFVTNAYFFIISGVSTFVFGVIKTIYYKNYKQEDYKTLQSKSIVICILLIFSATLFSIYSARLFVINDVKEYGIIMSIAIASFSFAELGYSIYNFIRAKKKGNILFQCLKGTTIVSSLYAITLTQVALLSATKSTNNHYNAITGISCGVISILIGIYLLVKTIRTKQSDEK